MERAEAVVGSSGSGSAAAEVVVRNAQGMHLRPATEFAKLALTTGCRVRVVVGENEVNGTSVLELAMLAIAQGTTLRIVAEGQGCDGAVKKLCDLVANDFRQAG